MIKSKYSRDDDLKLLWVKEEGVVLDGLFSKERERERQSGSQQRNRKIRWYFLIILTVFTLYRAHKLSKCAGCHKASALKSLASD